VLQKPPTLRENPKPYVTRPSLVETLKDRWNDEVVSVWRWATGLDVTATRESLEKGVENVWRNLQK
jgi:altered-inheritance-of-mitochondria protein 5